MAFQHAHYPVFDVNEDHYDCASPSAGYGTHLVPELQGLYQDNSHYRNMIQPPWTTTVLPGPDTFHMKANTGLCRIDSVQSLIALNHSTSSSYTHSDRHNSPTDSDGAVMSPEDIYDQIQRERYFHQRTTSMSNIQNFEDNIHELPPFDPDPWPSTHYGIHDGYVPRDVSTDMSIMTIPPPEPTTIETPVLRSRRPAARASTTKPQHTNRVNKRTTARRSATLDNNTIVDSEVDEGVVSLRPFHCPLAPNGCQSTFGSKNEWKRHFSTQHLRLEYWRCDQCSAGNGKIPNDFNRRDLFTQHVRRMHAHKASQTARKGRAKPAKNEDMEQQVNLAAQRCHRRLRDPPSKSICVICSQQFSGASSWDERMEHLGRHFENAKKENGDNKWSIDVGSWKIDVDAENWMIRHRILSHDRNIIATTDDLKD